jgi:alpha-mannosidase
VYPTWELEETYRELLAAQHHDNHECEGLCGFVGRDSSDKADAMTTRIVERTVERLSQRVQAPADSFGAFNATPVRSNVRVFSESDATDVAMPDVPPFGWRFEKSELGPPLGQVHVKETEADITLVRGDFSVTVDPQTGYVSQVRSREFPKGAISPNHPFARLGMIRGGAAMRFEKAYVDAGDRGAPLITVMRPIGKGLFDLTVSISLCETVDAVEVHMHALDLPRPDGGMLAGLETRLFTSFRPQLMLHDTPGAVHRLQSIPAGRRKYPSGDWMTSEQWFETIRNPFTAHSFVDLLDGDDESAPGVMLVHDGGQQFIREERGVRNLLSVYDPWDEDYFNEWLDAKLWIVPHGPLTHAERQRIALQLRRWGDEMIKTNEGGDIPAVFGPLSVDGAPGVLAHAFFRESMKSGENLPRWAGHRMFAESQGACDHPYVIRLVEWNGEPAEVTLKLAGDVALAAKTNLMGEVRDNTTTDATDALADTAWLDVKPADPPDFARDAKFKGEPIRWSQVRFRMRPHEIATIMADMVMGRKEWRDLDAKREVWATVHRET